MLQGGRPARFFIADTGWSAPPCAAAAPVGVPVSKRRSPPTNRLVDGRGAGVVATDGRLWELCDHYLAAQGLELDDLEIAGRGPRLLRVTIDREDGVDVQQLAAASRALSRRLDEMDPFDGPYSLEVTSPGLERTLRRPLHFRKSIGRDVTIKTSVEVAGSLHHRGVLEVVGQEDFVVNVAGAARRIAFGQVRVARTRFEWNKKPKSARKSG